MGCSLEQSALETYPVWIVAHRHAPMVLSTGVIDVAQVGTTSLRGNGALKMLRTNDPEAIFEIFKPPAPPIFSHNSRKMGHAR
jgi:hypothetical protein